MPFSRRPIPTVATVVFLLLLVLVLVPAAVAAPTLDRVTVTGRAPTRANAIIDAEEAAVAIVAWRCIGVRAYLEHWQITVRERQQMVDLVLPHSKAFLHSFEIIGDTTDAAGNAEITALARVQVDRLVTTLRTLHGAEIDQ